MEFESLFDHKPVSYFVYKIREKEFKVISPYLTNYVHEQVYATYHIANSVGMDLVYSQQLMPTKNR